MGENLIEFTIVVNGTPITEKFKAEATVESVVEDVLKKSGNTGQPLENWELRDSSGQVIDFDKIIESVVQKEGSELFLSLKAGVGGN